jgi:hypothetical protein
MLQDLEGPAGRMHSSFFALLGYHAKISDGVEAVFGFRF